MAKAARAATSGQLKRGRRLGGKPREQTPFLVWPEEGPAAIEGEVREKWDGEYGPVAKLGVLSATSNLVATTGKGANAQSFTVHPGMTVNVGFNYVTLKD